MTIISDVKLPKAFTDHIEQAYYGQVTEQSKLEAVVQDPDFLKNPLKHVALFSDHGILHGRDIASKIIRVIQQIQGLLVPVRTSSRLEFMLGYGAILAYLHDIGMKNFSAFGRAMHPEFAAQLMFTAEFDTWIDLLWQENAGNVAWRLINLAAQGAIQEPQRVLREMLALSMAHSKTKVPIATLNDRQVLRQTMQTRVGTDLHYLYHQQQVAIAEKKLAQQQNPVERDRLSEKLEQTQAELAQFVAANSTDSALSDRWCNPDVYRYYDRYEETAFSWLISDVPEIQLLTLDVIDTVRALRCADALRQRGTSFTTSAGYEVFVCQDTANAIYALRSGDRAQLFLLEGKDPISAGEANMANSNLDQEGNLRLAFTRGAFSSPEATQWAAFSAAVVIQDIQADVIGSFRRSAQECPEEFLQTFTKQEQEMQILVEGVDDNPAFADLICQELSQINPDLIPRIRAVTSLQYADLKQVERYLGGTQLDWGVTEKLHLLDQLVKTGQKVDPIEIDQAFTEVRLITVKAGEVLIERGVLSGFVYIPFQAGLIYTGLIHATERRAALPWVQIGDVEVIRSAIASAQVVAEQPVKLLMIPKQIYMRYWYAPYRVDEFTQMFAPGELQPRLPSKRTTSLEMDLQRLTRRGRTLPLAVHLMKLFPQPDQLKCFMAYLEELQMLQGETLFCQGDRPEALYFLELGQITVLCSEQRQTQQTFNSGDWIGGWEFYSRANYQHSTLVNKPSTLHRLSIRAMQQMQTESPQVAQVFAQYLLVFLAAQLNQARQEITMLLEERTEIIERLTSSHPE